MACVSLKGGEDTHTEERDVRVDADIGVLQVEVKEHQEKETQEVGRGKEESFLRAISGNGALLTP